MQESKSLSLVRVKCPHCSSPYDIEKCDLHKDALCEDCGKLFVAELDNVVRTVRPRAEISRSPIMPITPIHDATPISRPLFARPAVAIRSASEQPQFQEGVTQPHHSVQIGTSCAASAF